MPSTSSLNSRSLALRCAEAALDKKAEHLEIVDLRGLSSFTDFFVIASGNSEPHLKAIAQGIDETLRKNLERRPSRIDGFPMSQWVVMDYGDVLVHLFHEKKRSVYALEDLWGDAPRLSLNSPEEEPASKQDAPNESPNEKGSPKGKASGSTRRKATKKTAATPAPSPSAAPAESPESTPTETPPKGRTTQSKPRAKKTTAKSGDESGSTTGTKRPRKKAADTPDA